MKELINKWNGKHYTIVKYNEGTVELQRDDGTRFVIQIKELHQNYREVKDESK